MAISTVAVIGLGTMGAGIAEVAARRGYSVIGVDANDAAVDRGRSIVVGSTARAVSRGKMTAQEQEDLLAHIDFTTDMMRLATADLVIEAVPERLDLKQSILSKAAQVLPAHAILATNTSSLSVTEIAVATGRPARVVGIHFFNPAPVQAFVEIVRTVVTADDVVEAAEEFAASLGKQPVVIGDKAGFIANALLFGYLNHAVSMLDSKYVSREDLDAAMKLGCGLPMGPLALLDLIGLDTAYEILDTMYKQGRDRLHAPNPLLKQMVTAGLRGRKAGKGFYEYEAPNSPVVVDAQPTLADAELPPSGIDRVGVVGSGTMAAGIAEVAARAGKQVVLVARSSDKAQVAMERIRKSLDRDISRGGIDEAAAADILARVEATQQIGRLADADLVIESVVEDLEVKTDLFRALDRICADKAVLATTTSSLPVVELAAATERPDRVLGLHFFNPAPAMRLVEVVRTVANRTDVVEKCVSFVRELDKHPVVCRDRAGFVVNALLFPYLNDAIKMLEANYASADAIDLAMKKGCGYPMGPFELLDLVGLDVALAIQDTLYKEFREPGFAPAPRLEHLVTAGFVGRKAGHGFRVFDDK